LEKENKLLLRHWVLLFTLNEGLKIFLTETLILVESEHPNEELVVSVTV